MSVIRCSSILVAFGIMVGCAQQPVSEGPSRYGEMENALDAFQTRYDECIRIHGYNPDDPGDLGPNELAPSEREFSDCAYDALRTTLMLSTSQPRLYDAIIAEHRTMTGKVESGMMTRDERRARMRDLREDLRVKEIAQISKENQTDQIDSETMNLIRNATFSATIF